MNLYRKLIAAGALLPAALGAGAAPMVVCDFEEYPVGTRFQLWNFYGSESTTDAVVEQDPVNPGNKVLHITLRSWNDYIEFQLPDELAGKKLTEKYEFLHLDTYRHPQDPCQEWKHFAVFYGTDALYEDDGWPSQGPTSQWAHRIYELATPPEENNSVMLRLGYNSENTDYYIDNIRLVGRFDDYEVIEDGVLDISNPSSTSSSYTVYSTPLKVPAGTELSVYTSRYTYWTSPMTGEGRLNFYGGGERSYLGGEKGTTCPDWSTYTGDIHIYPYPEVNPSVKAGFYGIVMAHGNKKFSSDNIAKSISDGGYQPIWENNSVTLHKDATMAGESNNTARAYRIGHLVTEEGSQIMGYYKSNTYRVYYLIGCSGRDSELAGKIAPTGTSEVGIVKEGEGTYRITGNTNDITGGLSVLEGRVVIANDAAAAREGKLSGAVGGATSSKSAVTVYPDGLVAGSGNIGGVADIYGIVEPGTPSAPATLTVADFTGKGKAALRVRPSSRLRFNIASAESYDRIDVDGEVNFYDINAEMEHSDLTPVVEIAPAPGAALNVGDSFTLLTGSSKTSLDGKGFDFRVQYPKVCTWEVTESTADGRYTLTARVVSTEYSGQGDKIYELPGKDPNAGDYDDGNYTVDYTDDFNDPTPLRTYAAKANKYIGMAVSTWNYTFDSASDACGQTITREFNLLEAENAMKLDATEPSEGKFDFAFGDRMTAYAEKEGMDIRGHTLVWHQQVPGWMSSDGKKNSHNYSRDRLLEIMRNHINGVAGHFAGKVREWDVVNECLDDDQSIVYSNPDGYKLRQSLWNLGIGSDYVEQAFRMAHEADPEARLFLNDYSVEYKGDAKTEAFFNLVRSLVERGVPIHGVGLQCHFTDNYIQPERLAQNIRRYRDLGLEVAITELDIAQANPKDPEAARIQAEAYGSIVKAALAQPNCRTVLIWGLRDSDSWRQNNPLLFDGNLNPKEAYYAVHGAVRAIAEAAGLDEIEADATTAEVVGVDYYDLTGRPVSPYAKGFVIVRTRYADGTASTEKQLR